MSTSIRILMIEAPGPDSSAAGISASFPEAKLFCVETLADFKETLGLFRPDIILSEYRMPGFDGLKALEYALALAPEVPFIFLMYPLDDDIYERCMRAGAESVISKKHTWRIELVLQRCIRQKEQRAAYKRTLDALRESEERFRKILESAPIAIAIHTDGIIRYINPAGVRLIGAEAPEQVIGLPISRVVPTNSMDATLDRLRKLAAGEHIEYPVEDVFLKLDCTPRNVEVLESFLKYEGQNAIQVIVTDITERKKIEEKLLYLSYHDYLTALYNRRFFEKELRRADRPENLPITVIIADVDGLKQVNDTSGHDAGDEVIKKSAEAIKKGCRENDVAARIGGDEFAVILLKTDEAEAQKIIEDINRQSDDVLIGDGKLSISMGCASKRTPEKNLSEVLTEAENNMYIRKRSATGQTRY